MKKIKILATLIGLLFMAISLAACTKSTSSVQNANIRVEVKISDKGTSYTVTKDSTLLALAESQLQAEVTKGLINSVDGLKSNPANKAYLMFKVNGRVSAVGAADVKLKDGDQIEFYLSKF